VTIYAVVPVFNRLELTQSHVSCLRKQVLSESLHILIVNDGSTDGTAEWLKAQDDIEVLNGDGSLFWGGAVSLALNHLKSKGAEGDWVLFINNDTTVTEDFVQRLLGIAKTFAPAAVGSVIRDKDNHHRLLSLGVHIDAWRLLTVDLLDKIDPKMLLHSVLEVDALSGRGVIFPLAALIAAGGMRSRALPHYLADYELSLRVRKSGYRLLVSSDVAVYSGNDYGSAHRAESEYFHDNLFSIRSPSYLPAFLLFWWEASNWLQRLTLPLRFALFKMFPTLRKPRS
jgi:N-acetylglucosaminyl-diphospho-decaprenol L-rhamnosyltransferase